MSICRQRMLKTRFELEQVFLQESFEANSAILKFALGGMHSFSTLRRQLVFVDANRFLVFRIETCVIEACKYPKVVT